MVLLKDAMEHLRTKVRVDLHVPVVFEWKGRGGKCHAPGFTRNLSPEGLYVVAEVSPPQHVVARCRLVLPSLQAVEVEKVMGAAATGEPDDASVYKPDKGYEAVVVGRVVRTEAVGEQQLGFALHARMMILREFDLTLMP